MADKIDLTVATFEQLVQISQIGAKRAEAIIESRNQHGVYSSEWLFWSGIQRSVFKKIFDSETVLPIENWETVFDHNELLDRVDRRLAYFKDTTDGKDQSTKDRLDGLEDKICEIGDKVNLLQNLIAPLSGLKEMVGSLVQTIAQEKKDIRNQERPESESSNYPIETKVEERLCRESPQSDKLENVATTNPSLYRIGREEDEESLFASPRG